ncbi:MAG TPA: hypothetical protein VMW21_01860 [Patescibacteria group bacterium]|nr:hypothetical protein [Patescibacteria group bacterium]
MAGIERVGFRNPWLYPLAAEAAKAEISKMTGQANERAGQLRKMAADKKTVPDSKRVKPIAEISACNRTKKTGQDGKKSIDIVI